ncbi:M3 family metallopeptidase [Shewanella surugensis]|uniref:M3 family metallopeptidase n=1 Tax=Shewanella surugensis TaxID=212020 RepID=A0ABT0LBN8_9GAMM|nr:M3 family metallopeptidase [Shewanella surugensis]MCL1124767.1 M3 family metallopeptidase [Shewanella surugensis]
MTLVGFRPILLLLSIGFSNMAFSAVTPLSLLVKQCLQLPPLSTGLDPKTSKKSAALAERMAQLEHQLLGFYNIKDRVNYYKQFSIHNDDKESLLNCQFYLSDNLQRFLLSDQLTQLLPQLLNSPDNELSQLGNRLYRLLYNQQAMETKSKLHTAQAAFKQGLASQALTLSFNGDDCQLPPRNIARLSDQNEEKTPFNQSIASYLLNQSQSQCRKKVWLAYQARTLKRNTPILNTILDLQQAQAKKKGFIDYASLQTSAQILYSPILVKAFLNSQTHAIRITPWDLGFALKHANKSPFTVINSSRFLTKIYQALNRYGISIDIISPQVHRVWLNGRLLGELFISASKHFSYQPIRHLVVGQQFGQIEIRSKELISSYHDAKKMISTLTMAIADLGNGSHFYFNNTLGETHDSANIGRYWLQYSLTQTLIGEPQAHSREALIQAYSKQLHVFRAKVALNAYQDKNHLAFNDLRQEFNDSFGETWPQVDNYPVSFSAIVDEGPLYYTSLWQQSLALYLYQSTMVCQNQKAIFDTLIVNESAQSINQRLSGLLNTLMTPVILIKDMNKMSDDKHTPCSMTEVQ